MVSGSGFASNETVDLYVDSTGKGQFGSATSDAGGSFTVSAAPHLGPYGPHSLVGVGQTSGKLGVAYFSVTPKLLIDQTSVAAGGAVTVEGYGFAPQDGINLYCCGDNQTVLGKAVANHLGQFTVSGGDAATITIPAGTPPGTREISGKGSFQDSATGHVTVE